MLTLLQAERQNINAGEAWEARCAASWKQHGLSLVKQQQQRPFRTASAPAGAARSAGTAAGSELGVVIDRGQFAAQMASMPQPGAEQVTKLFAANQFALLK